MLFLEEMLFPRITACRCLMSICRINLPVEKGDDKKSGDCFLRCLLFGLLLASSLSSLNFEGNLAVGLVVVSVKICR